MPRNAIIMGAAGRDFHNFNTFFRNKTEYNVVAFTAAQIPYIEGRIYPRELAGDLYPSGIPIVSEEILPQLIREHQVRDVFFSYSDVRHEYVMHIASQAMANGASFHLLGPKDTMLSTEKPVISVVAVRTGAGKSTISRKVVDLIRKRDLRPVVVRHPMPYGSFRHPVQRYARLSDLDRYETTVEEREEFEGHIERGVVVFAGVDYNSILSEAQKEADVVIWDGGNNDFSFYKPFLNVVVADPLRAGDEIRYYPGEVNVRMADIVVINKVNKAEQKDTERVVENVNKLNPGAKIFRIRSETILDRPSLVSGKRVLAIEDGPTVTHGELGEAAGAEAARRAGAVLVDPRPYAVGSIKSAYTKYPNLGQVLPALGYGPSQLRELELTINSVPCDAVVLGTPADLSRLIKIEKPVAKVHYEAYDVDSPGFEHSVTEALRALRK